MNQSKEEGSVPAGEEAHEDDLSSQHESSDCEAKPMLLPQIETARVQPAEITASADRRDQGFTRAKVLILCPFKQVAFQVIEQIVLLLNKGKWKKTSKKKKFREEYASEEEAYNDFFRIGLALNWSKKGSLALKLYEQFY